MKFNHWMTLSSVLTCIAMLGTFASAAAADRSWIALQGEAIRTALEGRTVQYTDDSKATQEFNADGSTIYAEGRPSFGRWRASETQYCSTWPPASGWVCYDVFLAADDKTVRFVGDSGRIWDGDYL